MLVQGRALVLSIALAQKEQALGGSAQMRTAAVSGWGWCYVLVLVSESELGGGKG